MFSLNVSVFLSVQSSVQLTVQVKQQHLKTGRYSQPEKITHHVQQAYYMHDFLSGEAMSLELDNYGLMVSSLEPSRSQVM